MTELEKELLEALQKMVTLYDDWQHNEYSGTDLLGPVLGEADFAREIITKVKRERDENLQSDN